MKMSKILGLATLLLIAGVTFSFAHKSLEQKRAISEWYTINPGDDPHVPMNYTDAGTSDPGFTSGTDVAAIKVDPSSEVYTSGPNSGFPMVDVTGSSLFNAINSALSSQTEIPNRVELVTP